MKNPPKPPPCRLLRNSEWINEWELVEWYTSIGKQYKDVETKVTWFDKLSMSYHKQKLLEALEENKKCVKLKKLY